MGACAPRLDFAFAACATGLCAPPVAELCRFVPSYRSATVYDLHGIPRRLFKNTACARKSQALQTLRPPSDRGWQPTPWADPANGRFGDLSKFRFFGEYRRFGASFFLFFW